MLFSAPQRAADAQWDRESFHLRSIVLKETPSGTTIVGVRRYRGQKADSVSYVTSVPSESMRGTWICIHGTGMGEKRKG